MVTTAEDVAIRTSTLSVEGAELLVGTHWSETEALAAPLAKLKARMEAAKSGLYAGCVIHANKKSYTYTLVPSEYAGKTAGDAAVVKMLTARQEERDRIVLFVYAIKSGNHYVSDKYWLVGLQSDGKFLQNYEHICENQSQLHNELSSLEAISSYDIAYLDTQKTNIESVLGTDAVEAREGTKGWSFSKTEFLEAVGDEGCKIATLHKPVNIHANKMVYGSVAAALIVTGFASFSFLYQMDSNDYLDNSRAYREARDLEEELGGTVSSLSEKPTWTDKNFVETVKTQYFNHDKAHPYSPTQVAVVIHEINRTLPTYLAEWEFKKIRYENGRFFAEYHRNPKGKGVYFVLDSKIKSLDALVDSYRIEPADIRDLATVRDYEVIPSMTLSGSMAAQMQLQDMAKIKRTEAAMIELADDAEGVAKKLKRKFQVYRGLSFTDKWIMMEPVELAEDAKKLSRKLKKLKSEMKEIDETLNGIPETEIPQESLLGNKLDFISMMHVDSFFNWSPPVTTGTFPDKDSLRERAGKSKEESEYKPAILIYSVTVQTQEDMEEGKTRSYGVDDMMKLSHYIEKPFVDVTSVEYTRKDEQWEYNMVFYRKTPTYDKFFNENE